MLVVCIKGAHSTSFSDFALWIVLFLYIWCYIPDGRITFSAASMSISIGISKGIGDHPGIDIGVGIGMGIKVSIYLQVLF